MEPDVIRLYSSSPPPLDEAGEEEEEDEFSEFGEFGGFDAGGVTSSFSFSDIDTPTTFNQSNALEESPPDLCIKSIQNFAVSGKGVWANERKMVAESISSDENVTNVASLNQRALSAKHGENSPSIHPDVNSTGDGHIISNGYSESCANSELNRALPTCLQSIDTEVHSGLDINVADVLDRNQLINQTDNLKDSNNHSSHKEASEPEETKVRLCGDSHLSCRDAQETEGEHKQRENFVVCGHTGYLDGSEDCDDITEAEAAPSMDVDIISDTQLSGDTKEIHVSFAKEEVEEEEDIELPADPTGDEDFGDFRDVTQGFADFSRTESITQEGFPEFVTAMSRCSTDDEFEDPDTLKDFKEDDELAEEAVCDEGAFCSELPPSDSFADFSAAPFGGVAVGGQDNWTAFGPHEGTEENQDSWATFGEEQSTHLGKEEQDVETSTAPSSGDLQGNTAGFSCKLQHLFRIAFPSDIHPEVSRVTEVLPLHKFLQAQDSEEQRDQSSSLAQDYSLALWRHLQEIHSSHGLKFKWAGSHSNRILLDCLGIRNILFTGDKLQPVIVPMFAAGLGMLEPTKESQKSPASPALSPSAPVESGTMLCTQVASSLAISIDGVDPEIYELTTAKIENNNTGRSVTDAFTKLMESMEKTRTTARRPEKDEKISEEAAKVISLLPDLSFMQARVLMFPSILTPAANHI
ncbi:aftiphilin [Pseudorasbora parva]|uniref:aftiphilin n=1 Tax=Pseudorasbora parva TaxID=51549 RepID=UPI00351F2D93